MNKKLITKIVLASIVALVVVTLALSIIPSQTAFAAPADGTSIAAAKPLCSVCASWYPEWLCKATAWLRWLTGTCRWK